MSHIFHIGSFCLWTLRYSLQSVISSLQCSTLQAAIHFDLCISSSAALQRAGQVLT